MERQFTPSEQIKPVEQTSQVATHYRPSSFKISQKTDGSLKGYLKSVAALECQQWNQDRLISRLNRKASCLGKPTEISKPDKRSFYEGGNWTIAVIPALLGALLMPFDFIFRIVTFVVVWILSGFLFKGVESLRAAPAYRKAMNNYNTAVDADQKRVQLELKLKQEILQQIESVKTERQRTRKSLNALYSLSIIHANYRNLVAVSSFYDYFDKGICTQLAGRDGAYAFYEEDLRFRRLESKLDIIIEKLDEIAANQRYLALLIRDGNATLNRIEQQNNRMSRQLNSINENTAVTAYNTQCCAESMSVMESISIYRFLEH